MMNKHVLSVLGDEAELRLQQLLARRLELTPATAHALVLGGGVFVDHLRCTNPDHSLRPGQRVLVHQRPAEAPGQPQPRVAYRDRDLALLNKPSGLLSSPGRQGGEDHVERFVAQELGAGARLMHRLDRGASGLLLVSMGRGKARASLARQLERHKLQRRYLALVAGAPPQPELELNSALAMQRGRVASSQDPRARPARTRVVLLRRGPTVSLVQAQLSTGRTHQVRAHLSEAGCPILGDGRYGGPQASRLALHAHSLGLRHPRTRDWLELHAPLPAELRELLSRSG